MLDKYGTNLVDSLTDGVAVVDDLVLINRRGRQFSAGNLQSALDRLFRIGAPRSQPTFHLFQRTGSKEDRQSIGKLFENLASTVHVNL